MSRHTPGPWFVSAYDNQVHVYTGKQYIADFSPTEPADEIDQEARANALMAAAAPDLLEALQTLLASQRGLRFQEWRAAVAQGHAAIAKATGADHD